MPVINAGVLDHTSAAGTTTLAGGNLTVATLNKTGAATLAVDSPLTFSTGLGVTQLAGGTLSILAGSNFTTASLSLSGGAVLQTAAGASFTSAGINTLGTGGGTISNESDITLANISNSIPRTSH